MRLQILTCVTLGLTLIGCEESHAQSDFEINEFRSGLVCQNEDTGQPSHICLETETVQVTNYAFCIFDGNKVPCTWYGYEFTYDELSEDVTLTCATTSKHATNVGNPKEQVAKNTRKFDYQITLEKGSSHFFNPQYSVFSYGGSTNALNEISNKCHFDGREVFESNFAIQFPTKRSVK